MLVKLSHLFKLLPLIGVLAFLSPWAYAQSDDADTEAEEEIDPTTIPVISEIPLMSPRASGMAGALASSADDVDAIFYNPAGIGGLRWEKKKVPWLRKMYLPYLTAASNRNATKLNKDFKDEEGARDRTVGEAIIDAHAGKPQFGRANLSFGAVIGRTIVMPYYDTQFAATSRGEESGIVDTHYRSTGGIAFGFSVSDSNGYFQLGYSGYTASITDLKAEMLYQEIIDTEARKQIISDNAIKYSGLGHNLGLTFRLGKTATPTISFVAKNLSNSTFEAKDGESEALQIDQNISTAFGIAPEIGKWGLLNFSVEADRLTDSDVTLAKKFKVGLELLGGLDRGLGSYATWALRAGYNDAGVSYGLSLNLGLIGLAASDESIDVGFDNNRVTERRFTGLIYVNVSEF